MAIYLLYSGRQENMVDPTIEFSQKNIVRYRRLTPLYQGGKGKLANLYWWLISRYVGICEVFDKDTNELKHYSYVMKKSYKFPFMTEHMYQVGPVFTAEEFRGQGLFPYCVTCLKAELLKHDQNAEFIALTREENIASRRGFEKAKMMNTGRKFKKDRFKIYHEIE